MKDKAVTGGESLGENPQVEKKAQKASASYTIRQFGVMTTKLKEMEIITEEQEKQLRELHTIIIQQWVTKMSLS